MNNIINKSKFFNSFGKTILVSTIKGFASESKRTRIKLLKGKTEVKKQKFNRLKEFIGYNARHYLLAYAYMRGEHYLSIERTCRVDNKPRADIISAIVKQYSHQHDLELINSWLNFS
jgi:hypothetical protein